MEKEKTVKKKKTETAAEKPTVKKTEKAKKTAAKDTAPKKAIETKVSAAKSVLFVASEANPFIGTGGLADVIGSLPKTLAENSDYDVRVVLPLYGEIEMKYRDKFMFLCNFNVPLSWRNQYCGVYAYKYEGVTFYFIDNEYYFKRRGLYGHYDDGERFAYFSKAVIEMMNHLDYYPEILHCNDWQTALSVVYLKVVYGNGYGYDHIKTLFTIHNIEYQGKFGFDALGDLFGLPDYCKEILEYDGCLNLMKGAIQLSDRFSTVSERYASEIKNPYFAHGLEYMTTRNDYKLVGILNGIDVDYYDPETDKKLFANYGADDFSNKAVCKRELQNMLGLPVRENTPIIAVISRLVAQKGLDLLKCVADDLLSEDVQLVVLGTGDAEYQDYFKYLESRYDAKCRTVIAYNKDLAAKIYSGADIFLMPSKHEPCGLSQMIACRYGAIPVVRETGGLADSITPHNNDYRKDGNGFSFKNYNAHEMLYVLKDAIFTYGNKKEWNTIMKNAMTSDFSWKKSAAEYVRLYDNILI